MKRLPLVQKADPQGRHYWLTTAERDGDPAVFEAKAREFAYDRPDEPPPGVDRRTFMTLMGASMALAGLAACRRPEEKILPFSHQPEDTLPGRPEFFATSMPFYGTAIGLVVESNDGRPTKIEGNPKHPETPRGATSSFIQGHVLNLYDPDRSKSPRKAGVEVSMDEAMAALSQVSKEILANKGKGVAILVGEHRSFTTLHALLELASALPAAPLKGTGAEAEFLPLVKHEPFGRANARVASKLAFNDDPQAAEMLDTVLDVGKASVIVSFDADFLGHEGSPLKAAAGFAKNRSVEKGNMSRVYVAEPCPTITSNACDHRLRTQARRMTILMRALAAELAKLNVPIDAQLGAAGQLTEAEKKWVAAAAKDLASARAGGLVVVGRRQFPPAHALGMAINHALGSNAVAYKRSFDKTEETNNALKKLCDAARAGQISTLVILGGNPVFTAPADLNFAEVMGKVKTTIHLSSHVDETSALATWHIPRAHELETWGDAVSEDGTIAITQPLISPMYDGKTDAEILHRLVGGVLGAYELTRRTIDRMVTPVSPLPAAVNGEGAPAAPAAFDLEKRWRRALFEGVVQASPPGWDTIPVLNKTNIATSFAQAPAEGFEIVFAPCAHAYDGRYANNGWLQETPDPIHKTTWTNVAALSAATAKKLGVVDGDLVKVQVGDASVELPVAVTYGHADESCTVYVGQGRKFAGSVCKGVGVDVGPIRKGATWDIATGSVTKASGAVTLAVTQGHFMMEGRPLIREQTVKEYKEDPSYAKDLVIPAEEKHDIENIYGEEMPWNYKVGHQWGMTIDLTTCTGCTACLTACVAENNISVVGAEGVHKSREMHWIRIDRYFAGKEKEGGPSESEDEVHVAIMPMLCQHCENAPCEQVCPVAATTHSPEGINEMTYNRCIGTKYCGNNCPFKVRRFNFFHYTKSIPETLKLQLNPDVTVRSRGVMEKCSFCVQRVQEAKIASKRFSDNLKDVDDKAREKARVKYVRDELLSACQQACPTGAITFGDLNDPASAVAQTAAYSRKFQMLEEINVRPRVNYLAKIRNPNEELEPPKPKAAESHGGEKQDKSEPRSTDSHKGPEKKP
ncbi:MAG: TAT-variant-translocated molybdopterin oxidoreductase [Polyangiaceae bacterium]